MGFGGISIWQLLIVLAIVVLLFGTKKLRGIGTDLGGALKGFKKAIGTEGAKKDEDGKLETDKAEENKEADAVDAPSAQAEQVADKK